MKLIKKSILLLALAGGTFLSGGKAYAQQTLVDVRVDSAAILIGEQTVLHLTVTADKDKAVQLVIPRYRLLQPGGLEGVDGSCQCRQTGGVLRY